MKIVSLYRNINRKQWLFVTSFWVLVATIVSTQLYLNGLKVAAQTSWIKNFYTQLPIWLMWAVATPLIFGTVKHFPILSGRWYKALMVYAILAACLSFLFTNLALVHIFTLWNYLDLSTATLESYTPYFFSRFIGDIVICFYIISVSVAIQAYANKKNRELNLALLTLKNNQLQNQLTQAQLQALKLQLSPHFLFNTLHTISSLTTSGYHEDSVNMTTRLGDFLRRSLEFEEHQLVTVQQELDFFDLYIAIESQRFKDRLTVTTEVDPNILNEKIPNLILQPLVENAIKHGISKQSGANRIDLSIKLEKGQLKIKLFNQGKALPEDFNIVTSTGIGLQNVNSRLEKLFGESNLCLFNDMNRGGVVAKLSIPVNFESKIPA